MRDVFGRVAEDAPEVFDDPIKNSGERVADTNLNDTEKIPMKEDIDDYFRREVLPLRPMRGWSVIKTR